MRILVIEHFAGNLDGKDNDRFVYLCKMLAVNPDNKVELITSSFNHEKKCKKEIINVSLYDFKITLLDEPGYKKNVCLKRFYSHYKFGKVLKKYLRDISDKPDVIYCGIPSLSCASIAAKYGKKHKIRFIIDVQDLWPEAFKLVLHIPILSDLIFTPFTLLANKSYRSADAIIGVSETYTKRALKSSKKGVDSEVVYLGTDRKEFDKNNTSNEKYLSLIKEGVVNIAYCGTLGSSYDLSCVIEAIKSLYRIFNIQFIVMGDGPRKKEFEDKSKNIPVIYTGRLPYAEMCGLLKKCDIAVNPIAKGAAQSIINKHMDYAMAGLPVINTQECEEYRNLLEKYKAGINCRCECIEDVVSALQLLLDDIDLRKSMGANSRKMGEECFDRQFIYRKIEKIIYEK